MLQVPADFASKIIAIDSRLRELRIEVAAIEHPHGSQALDRILTDLPPSFGEKAMAKLEFNDERIEAREGETLVQAARRHGSYVWFLCDGRGICQTCECRIISGDENLSEVSEFERASLGEKRRRRGYRLGCQARLVGSGPVLVVSRAEELRRRAREVLLGSKGRSLWERLQDLSVDSLSATVDLLTGVTSVSPHAIPPTREVPAHARSRGGLRPRHRAARWEAVEQRKRLRSQELPQQCRRGCAGDYRGFSLT